MSNSSRTRAWRAVFAPAVAILGVVLISAWADTYTQYLSALVVISCLVGASLVMIVGYARVIMLATGAMMAIGAYGSALLMMHFGVPFLVTLPLAWVAGAISGIVLAVPATRFRGHHLAMATMVFQFLVIIGIREWASVTGGPLGLRFPQIRVLGSVIESDIAWLVLIGISTALPLVLIAIILAGRFGKNLRAISASEVAADAFGIDIPRFKIAAFAISSGFISYAGALFAPRTRIIDPDSFGFVHSVIALGYPIVGGLNSIWGGIIGGAMMKVLPEALKAFGKYQELLVALLVVVVMVAWPSGILGLFARFSRRKPPKPLERIESNGGELSTTLPEEVKEGEYQGRSGGIPLEIEGVTKSYGALAAIDGATLSIAPGEIHGLIGPNGAGKTTLFNAVSGFVQVDAGSIKVFGKPVQDLPSRVRIKHGVTRTFQNVAIFRELSCLDNVIIGLGENGVAQAVVASVAETFDRPTYQEAISKGRAALTEVGIGHLADLPAGSLSLGNQRLLEIARAVISRPQLLLLDEPISGVSREEEERVGQLLVRLNREHGISMLLVEHNIAFVLKISHRISVMSMGHIIAQGRPDEVIRQRDVREIYFGETNASDS